jgi:hypothetical protein
VLRPACTLFGQWRSGLGSISCVLEAFDSDVPSCSFNRRWAFSGCINQLQLVDILEMAGPFSAALMALVGVWFRGDEGNFLDDFVLRCVRTADAWVFWFRVAYKVMALWCGPSEPRFFLWPEGNRGTLPKQPSPFFKSCLKGGIRDGYGKRDGVVGGPLQ